ncbi:MAG: TIGR03759 family integrating conjugative element protein [Gammaproteobacteria bacterium]
MEPAHLCHRPLLGHGVNPRERRTCGPCLGRALGKREARTVIGFFNSLVSTTLVSWLTTVPFVVHAEPSGASEAEQTPIAHSSSSATTAEQSSRWGLTLKDWSRYQRLMQGPRGIWSPNLDPVTALGVHAESDPERRRYAEILVQIERERWERELAFEKVVQQVKRELYPNEPLLDPERVKALIEARTREPPYRAGDRLLLFVNLECHACDRLAQHLASEVQSLPGLQLDVFAVGRVRDEDIQGWATKLKLPEPLVSQGRLSLNHDNNTLNTLTRDQSLSVPVLIRARGEAYEMLPADPVVLARWSTEG